MPSLRTSLHLLPSFLALKFKQTVGMPATRTFCHWTIQTLGQDETGLGGGVGEREPNSLLQTEQHISRTVWT